MQAEPGLPPEGPHRETSDLSVPSQALACDSAESEVERGHGQCPAGHPQNSGTTSAAVAKRPSSPPETPSDATCKLNNTNLI